MFEIWNVVRVKNEAHARAEQVGVVTMRNLKDHPDEVVVKFDKDCTEESVQVTDLAAL